MTHFEQSLGDSGKEKPPFERKTSPAEPDGASISRFQLEVSGGREDKRHTVEEILMITNN